ncbi:MAG: hypothetical protein C4523_10890 [Myxococcales bacterium]|jgi:hypothetical protein|nr:MAG: hypothetical protein C4523_10890 [Myxococcales bacterium]
MTPQEFKAWFDGFTEALEGTPTDDQWKRIKARVAEIDGKPVTYPVYLERYWPRWWETRPYYQYLSSNGGSVSSFTVSCNASAPDKYAAAVESEYDSRYAMYARGKADAAM